MYTHIYIYTHIHICIYAHIHTHTHTHTHTYTHTYVYIYIYIFTKKCHPNCQVRPNVTHRRLPAVLLSSFGTAKDGPPGAAPPAPCRRSSASVAWGNADGTWRKWGAYKMGLWMDDFMENLDLKWMIWGYFYLRKPPFLR